MTSRQFIVLAVCVSIFALGQFHRASGSVFTPVLMDRFALSAAVVAGLVSAMFFATIAVQVPFGWALDRIGPRRVLGACILLVATGTAVFAIAGSYDAVLASRVLIGVGLASMGAATHVIVARNFPARDFGYISGLVVTLGGVGGLLGTWPLALALARLPWAVVFGAVAGLTLLLALAVFRAVRPGAPATDTSPGKSRPGGYASLLRQRGILAILTLACVTFAPITAITGLWGGPFLQDALGLGPEAAGAILLVFFCATIAGGYTFGVLDRHVPSRRAVILTGAGLSVASLALLALIPAPGRGVAIALLLLMIFSQQFHVCLAAHLRHVVPDHLLGRAATLFQLVAVAAIPLLQIGFGMVLDGAAARGFPAADQYRLAFAAMGGLIAICAVVYAIAADTAGGD